VKSSSRAAARVVDCYYELGIRRRIALGFDRGSVARG
jgi:hypothetical protein